MHSIRTALLVLCAAAAVRAQAPAGGEIKVGGIFDLTGITSDVARRCVEHNAGDCIHTSKYRVWLVDVVIEFPDEKRAVAFERYLKAGSGVAFAQRHLR